MSSSSLALMPTRGRLAFAGGLLPILVACASQLSTAASALGGPQPTFQEGSAASHVAEGHWSDPFPPRGRWGQIAVYDSFRDRMIIFGGYGPSYHDDAWAFQFGPNPQWGRLAPTGVGPTGRYRHSAIYDSVRNRVVVFGGVDNTGHYSDETWVLSFDGDPSWALLTTTGPLPSARDSHTAVYDPVLDRMVVFGGQDTTGYLADVWELPLGKEAAWLQLTPAGIPPTPRVGHAAVWDVNRNQMVVLGGLDGLVGWGYPGDVWVLRSDGPSEWIEIPFPPEEESPVLRRSFTAVLDATGDRIIGFGGYTPNYYHNGTFGISLTGTPSWLEFDPTGDVPTGRIDHSAILLPTMDAMLVFGGWNGIRDLAEMNLLSLEQVAWSEVTNSGTFPAPRKSHVSIVDAQADRMLLFGGAGADQAGVWELPLSGDSGWVRSVPTGTRPAGWSDASAVVDSERNRMIVFGGYAAAGKKNSCTALSLSGAMAWTTLSPIGTLPSARTGHSAIHDPVRNRMIVYGGSPSFGLLSDAWELSLGDTLRWTQLFPVGQLPAGRRDHTAVYDSARDRMIVFGGLLAGAGSNELWSLTLGETPVWTELLPSGPAPPARWEGGGVFDAAMDRMVFFGGQGDGFFNDAWELSFTPELAWRQLDPTGVRPTARGGHSGVFDPTRRRMVVFGGFDGTYLDDVWMLEWGIETAVQPEPAPAIPIASTIQTTPNPFRSFSRIDFSVAASVKTRLEIFDVSGRLITTLVSEVLSAGPYGINWQGVDGSGRRLPSGVYVCRLQAGDQSTSRKVVLLD